MKYTGEQLRNIPKGFAFYYVTRSTLKDESGEFSLAFIEMFARKDGETARYKGQSVSGEGSLTDTTLDQLAIKLLKELF